MTELSHLPCPLPNCGSSDAYSWNDETGLYYCHSCGGKGILPDYKTHNTVIEEGYDLEPYYRDYRGISRQILENFNAYFTKVGDKETIHYTYPNATKHRQLPKSIKVSGKLDAFYGQDDYTGGKTITITEGEEDRLSVIQMMGDWPTVSVPGATPSKEFWVNAREYLKNFDTIKLSVDNDEHGDALAQKFYRLFPGKVYRLNHGKYKDANDFLVQGDIQSYKSTWFHAQRVKPDSILSSSDDFKKLYNETPDYEYFPTGIEELDEKMLGIHKGAFTVVLAETGVGKSLAPDTEVLRYDGQVVKAIDVSEGDLLMGPDSKPRTVTNVNLQRGPMYRITPTKGEPFECNADHILSLKKTGTEEVQNVVLSDYLQWDKSEKHKWKLYRTGVDFAPIGPNLPSFAYSVGAYLGAGCAQGPEIRMGKTKEPVFQSMMKSGHLLPTRNSFDQGTHYIGFSRNSLLWDYLSNQTGQSEDCLSVRRIPQDMKRGHRETRKAILAGLLDTNGSITSGGAEITQKSETLADDICFVARSLGFAAYKKVKTVKDVNYFRVSISGDLTNLPTKRLTFPERKQKKDVLKTGFTVESIGEGEFRGIALDGDHLFLLGDFTVTHNTEFFRYIENEALKNTDYTIATCHGEETQLRSLLGLVSYDLQDNLTRKDLVESKGREEDVMRSIESISANEKLLQFSLKVDDGVDEIVEQVRFLTTAMGVDYIFLEPIQDFVSASNTTEKESLLTDLTNKLKRLAPEINVGIVVIAHANADGEAKYCKSIVQGAAYEIRLKRDQDSTDPEERNRTYLSIGRKNRTGGGSGPAGSLMFDTKTYMLTPVMGPIEPETPISKGKEHDDIPF